MTRPCCLLPLLFPLSLLAQLIRVVGTHVGVGLNSPEPVYGSKVYHYTKGKSDNIRYCSFLQENSICFKRSENGGKDWIDSTSVFSTPSGTSTMVNGARVFTRPSVACDLSNGSYQGRIYIAWSDLKNGKTNLDVFLVYSDDQGKSWTEPILLSYYPNHRHQFDPEVEVDIKSGAVYVVYLDQKNFLRETHCDINLAVSSNGGLKFEHQMLNPGALKYRSTIRPTFAQDPEGLLVCWKEKGAKRKYLIGNKNPELVPVRGICQIELLAKSLEFSGNNELRFRCNKACTISAELSKPLDASFHEIWFLEKYYEAGEHSLDIRPYLKELHRDNYILTLHDATGTTYSWITAE